MMQRQTNNLRFVRTLAVVICGVAVVLPSVAFARQNQAPRGNTGNTQQAAVANANFCSSIDTLSDKIMKDITLRETRYATNETQKQNTLTETLAKRDAAKLQSRNTWDSSRNEIFSGLMARATSKEEQAAVDAFQKSIDTAVTMRRKSIDTSLETFKTGVDKTLVARKGGVEDAIKTFRFSTDIALVDAKANCASGTPSVKVREIYVSDLTEGKQVFLAAVQTAQKRDDTMKKLVNERDASIEAANNAFKKALTQAQKELKKSFPGA